MKTRVRMENNAFDVLYFVDKFEDNKWKDVGSWVDRRAAEMQAQRESFKCSNSSVIIRQFEDGEEILNSDGDK